MLHSSCYYIYSDIVFDFMIDYVFEDEIKNGICKIKKVIICKDSIKYSKKYNPTLNFILGDIEIKYPISRLFDVSMRSVIKTIPDKGLKQFDIVLGFDFMRQFNYTIFDYDNNQIGFYSDTIVIGSPRLKYKIKILYIIIVLITLITLILMIKNKSI